MARIRSTTRPGGYTCSWDLIFPLGFVWHLAHRRLQEINICLQSNVSLKMQQKQYVPNLWDFGGTK